MLVFQTKKQNFDYTIKHRILHRIKILNNEGYCNNRRRYNKRCHEIF